MALAGLCALLVGGCGDDTTRRPDGGTPTIEIGTGGILVYEPVSDGDTMYLSRGCQGSQHLWISVRAWGLDTQPALIRLNATRARDDLPLSLGPEGLLVRLRFQQLDGLDELTGLQLQIPDPDLALGEEVRVMVEVSEDFTGGRTVRAERLVAVEWGDEVCGERSDGAPPLGGDGGPAGDGGALADGGSPGDAAVEADAGLPGSGG